MIDLFKLRNDLKRDEGIRLKPYYDTTGNLTIGIGRNLTDNGITEQEAEYLLNNDINKTLSLLENNLDFWNNLSPRRKRALTNMAFNLGTTRFLGFKRMIKALRDGDYKKAAAEALDSKWSKQVGLRAKRIADMIMEG